MCRRLRRAAAGNKAACARRRTELAIDGPSQLTQALNKALERLPFGQSSRSRGALSRKLLNIVGLLLGRSVQGTFESLFFTSLVGASFVFVMGVRQV